MLNMKLFKVKDRNSEDTYAQQRSLKSGTAKLTNFTLDGSYHSTICNM